LEWYQDPNKSCKNVSIVWRALTKSFPFVGDWVVWWIRNGQSVQVGMDPWIGDGESFKLSPNFIHLMKVARIIILAYVKIESDIPLRR